MKLTVGNKILLGFSVLIVLMLVIGVYSVSGMSEMNKGLTHLYEKKLVGMIYLQEANVALVSRGREEKNFILETDRAEREEHIANIKKYGEKFKENLAGFKNTIESEADKAKIADIEADWEKFLPIQNKVIELDLKGKDIEAVKEADKGREIINNIESDIDSFSNQMNESAREEHEKGEATYESTRNLVIAILVLSLILGAATALTISRMISKPIVAMAGAAQKIADGDLTNDNINVTNNDEIGELANSFNVMTHGLRSVIQQVIEASQRVAASSEELSASSEETTAATEQVANTIQQLSAGATNQAEEVESTSTIVNQMSASIQQISANTQTVSHASINVSNIAEQGTKDADNAVSKIERIKEVSSETAEVIMLLGQESKKIGQIVDVIKGIADQTNLLALNAAIEAARAGEQGRGFAVVAEEVRKLAEQSSSSAQQIAELISNIQKETNKAVEVMEVGSKEVAEGVVIVNKAGESFNVISVEVNKVVEQIQQVSAATQQMAVGSSEVVKSIDNIASIAQQTAASSQEVSAASQEQTAAMEEVARSAQDLAKLAEDLQNTVSRFKV